MYLNSLVPHTACEEGTAVQNEIKKATKPIVEPFVAKSGTPMQVTWILVGGLSK